ncbi:Uma2 family endonuclease [Oscillatoria sp. FACHB-1406]|uniref:Uma2 family endonuclease n=1 Tax=Oscillatoria sp. FACHB-1406 TaxID=2692846 RepID=UPI001688A53D|nr:Uma2 family endonuclease [Oscillatoria sp. FACHB-1406]MBD2577361.1 Uma2 family endonuclease [Oscillatoria sp. FACHB-1406]
MVFISPTSIAQEAPPRPPKETLPTMYDLPSENPEKPGLPDEFHALQSQLLSRTLQLPNYSPENCFAALDLNLYYTVKHPLWYKRPDWFLAINVPRLYEGTELRRNYVIWQEEHNPYVIVELLSPGTSREDLGRFYREEEKELEEAQLASEKPGKLEVYEKYLRVPHYFVYSRYTQQLRYFKLEGGLYREQTFQSEKPKIWLEDLEIGLGIWEGVFEGIPNFWLRWCDAEGNWLLTDTEQAQLKLRQAARNLLATGMGTSQIAEILGISVEEVEESAYP